MSNFLEKMRALPIEAGSDFELLDLLDAIIYMMHLSYDTRQYCLGKKWSSQNHFIREIQDLKESEPD